MASLFERKDPAMQGSARVHIAWFSVPVRPDGWRLAFGTERRKYRREYV